MRLFRIIRRLLLSAITIIVLTGFSLTIFKIGKKTLDEINNPPPAIDSVISEVTALATDMVYISFEYGGVNFVNMPLSECRPEDYVTGDEIAIVINQFTAPTSENPEPTIVYTFPREVGIEDYIPFVAAGVVMLIAFCTLIRTIVIIVRDMPLFTGEECTCIIDDIIVTSEIRTNNKLPCIYKVICSTADGRRVTGEYKGYVGLFAKRGKICRAYVSKNPDSNKVVVDPYIAPPDEEIQAFEMRNPDLMAKEYHEGYTRAKNIQASSILFYMVFICVGLWIIASTVIPWVQNNGGENISDLLFPLLFGAVFVILPLVIMMSSIKKSGKKNDTKNAVCVQGMITDTVTRDAVIKGKHFCEITVTGMTPAGERFVIENHPVLTDDPSVFRTGDEIDIYLSGKDFSDKSINIPGYLLKKQSEQNTQGY